MSQRDGFASGFFLGALLGGAIGGVVGVLATTRRSETLDNPDTDLAADLREPEQSIESTRRSLETKIAQLNLAIDDVRQQLGGVNGASRPDA
ncbi:MAG: hypothetical protein F6J87_08590 [Spirulina sp. SIO3F2]|nr:hypothetical protein [Spirulina sp. SIO3F2]